MPNGLSTIRRGIGYGPLGTISRGYLGQFVELFFVKCPPILTALSTEPALAAFSTDPTLAAMLTEPALTSIVLEPGMGSIATEPGIEAEDCLA